MCSQHEREERRREEERKQEEEVHAEGDRAWPEEQNGYTSRLRLFFRRWTYSYMSRVLDKGSRQMLPDGTHLSEDDLYLVPPAMESKFLSSEFR